MKSRKGLDKGLLNQILGIGRVPRHAQRRRIELIEKRQGVLLETAGPLFGSLFDQDHSLVPRVVRGVPVDRHATDHRNGRYLAGCSHAGGKTTEGTNGRRAATTTGTAPVPGARPRGDDRYRHGAAATGGDAGAGTGHRPTRELSSHQTSEWMSPPTGNDAADRGRNAPVSRLFASTARSAL